ncbi:hypothetical protein [Methylorubrum extorquens]|uniref:Uncharacterized protein n=1 Tax=Methylorubrum extorquens DSM 13060 TaxID=882800 RepID=H1KV26_METEX|nr:hypothetical protein [Methylorubrum extorquens]EHP77561.1 hypothetical protein MetexDRAFT_6489 [Methylorubrum extorquens DSM 13060]
MSTQIHITPKEALVLRTFAASQYYDGPGTATWLPDVTENSGLNPQSFAAVYGSLVAKGIMLTKSHPNDPHDTCELTAAGEHILQAPLAESAPGAA